MTKVCGKCGLEKDFSQYHKSKNGKYGLQSMCKDCEKERRREYYLAHRGEELSHRREHYLAHREENREKVLSRGREYYLKHRKEILSYREENRDKILSQKREYHKKNREKELKYRFEIRNKALDLYGHKCELCGSVDCLEFHHINLNGVEERKVCPNMSLYKSLADGNKRSDLQLLCRSCHHKIHNDLRSSI